MFFKMMSGFILLLILLACGKDNYVAEDKSADYQSAKSLPPLKKTEAASSMLASSKVDALFDIAVAMVELDNGKARLQLDTSFDQAWQHLGKRLKRSGLTIHRRNVDIAQYAIGCAGIDSRMDVPVAKKKGKIPFLNKKIEIQEYCALGLTSENGKSFVSVLNREGEEVSTEKAKPVLQKIIDIK